jgi:hypothetical protein
MGVRGFAIAGALVSLLLVSGCAAKSDQDTAGATVIVVTGMRPLDTPTGLPLRLAPGWFVRDTSTDMVWLISKDGKSAMSVSRLGGPWPDYAARVRREDRQVAALGQSVADPLETRLFGAPALAAASSGRSYSRIGIGSEKWSVSVHRGAPYDAQWAAEVRAMLSVSDAEMPEIPVP